MVFLCGLITCDPILDDILRFWTNPEYDRKSKMPDEDGRHSEMITQLLRHVTSSPHDTEVKGNIFTRNIHPPSLVGIAFIFSELRRGADSPQVEDQKKPGLNRVKGGLKIQRLSMCNVDKRDSV